jgi:phosphoribosylaminoimidazole-succinocarboxamide synthase
MDDTLRSQLPYTLREADFPALGQLYRGKVRDNYSRGDRIVMITTDRLSAFDRVLTTVPFKGELLNRLTTFWFDKTKDVAPNHILDVPDPSVLVVRKLQPLAVEMVVRGYLTGSLWREYEAGKGAKAYGSICPATCAGSEVRGVSSQHGGGGATEAHLPRLVAAARSRTSGGKRWRGGPGPLRRRATGQKQRGLILVDANTSSARRQGKALGSTRSTADSSRYWVAEGSQQRSAGARIRRCWSRVIPAVADPGAQARRRTAATDPTTGAAQLAGSTWAGPHLTGGLG